jgi:hypothetical protein
MSLSSPETVYRVFREYLRRQRMRARQASQYGQLVVVRRGVPVDADTAGEVLLAAGVSGFVDRIVAWIATARKVERAGDLLLMRGDPFLIGGPRRRRRPLKEC